MTVHRVAARMGRLGGGDTFEVITRARALEHQGKHIIHLEVGEPDFDTPANIVRRGVQALEAGETHYAPSQGILPLRESVARHVYATRGATVAPSQVVISPGCKPLIFTVLLALVDEGDEVVCGSPAYPAFESVVSLLGGRFIPVPLLEHRGFRLDVDRLESLVTPRTRLVILNSPHSPTASVLPEEDLRRIADLAVRKDLLVLSDEIYSRIVYGAACPSIYSQPGMTSRTVLVDGFSKSHAMTGWRLGYGVMPEDLARQVTQLIHNSISCVATFVQWAGLEALEGPQDAVAAMVAELQRRRDVIVDGLNSLPGVSCQRPTGAFYVFPNVRQLGMPSRQIADYFLQEAGVACLGGTSFGPSGEGYLRISYANSLENIEKAVERMREALKRLPLLVTPGSC